MENNEKTEDSNQSGVKDETVDTKQNNGNSKTHKEDRLSNQNVFPIEQDKEVQKNYFIRSISTVEDGISTRSNTSYKKKIMDSAEALEHALLQLGHFDLYQKYALFLLCIPNLFSAMYSLNYVFVADQIPFR